MRTLLSVKTIVICALANVALTWYLYDIRYMRLNRSRLRSVQFKSVL